MSKLIHLVCCHPVRISPVRFQVIDLIVGIRSREIFNIYWPDVMVPKRRINLNRHFAEGVIEVLGDGAGVLIDFFICVVPDIVS